MHIPHLGLVAALRGAFCVGMAFAVVCPARADEVQEARQLLQSGQHASALARLDKLLAKKPADPQARFLKGVILADQGKSKEAAEVFLKLTRDHPELPEPHNNLAVLYASQGQYEKARAALERSIRAQPGYAMAYENLGDVYAKLASGAYEKALQLDAGNEGARGKLALARELAGGSPRTQRAATLAAPVLPATGPKAPAAQAAAQPKPAAQAIPSTQEPSPAPVSVATAVTKPLDPRQSEIAATLDAWARAWSRRDADAYLSFYDRDFVTPGGLSRAAWEKMRRARVARPKAISVAISAPQISPSADDRVTVTFRQSYRSDVFKGSSTKTLVMVNVDGRWLIREEESSN